MVFLLFCLFSIHPHKHLPTHTSIRTHQHPYTSTFTQTSIHTYQQCYTALISAQASRSSPAKPRQRASGTMASSGDGNESAHTAVGSYPRGRTFGPSEIFKCFCRVRNGPSPNQRNPTNLANPDEIRMYEVEVIDGGGPFPEAGVPSTTRMVMLGQAEVAVLDGTDMTLIFARAADSQDTTPYTYVARVQGHARD